MSVCRRHRNELGFVGEQATNQACAILRGGLWVSSFDKVPNQGAKIREERGRRKENDGPCIENRVSF